MLADYRAVGVAGLLLAGAALIGTALLSLAEVHSRPFIDQNKRQAMLDSLAAIIPGKSFDNDILHDVATFEHGGLLALRESALVYRARRAGSPVAAAFRLIAPDGYAGEIELLMAIRADGVVSGVRVISHQETPGLGDPIEIRRSDWIDSFAGRSRGDPADAGWRVIKDGGVFDQFTGATITPRAVVRAVHNGLRFFDHNRLALFTKDLPPQAVQSAGPAQE